MYTDEEYTGSNKALRWFVILFCLFVAAIVAVIVYALLARIPWLTYGAAAFLAVGSLFIWGNFGVRIVLWHRFLNDMKNGLERQVEGVIASIDEQDAQKEGLEFRAVRLLTGEESDKIGGRLLYVDTTRLPLPAGSGQKVSCKLFGNYIKDMTLLEEN